MNFNKIDKTGWSRAESFNHYMITVPCTYSICVNVDITNVLAVIKKKKLKLFPVLLFGITNTVNKHREFKMAMAEDGNVGYYDFCYPCYTVLEEASDSFKNKCTEFNGDFDLFYADYLRDSKDANNKIPSNVFNVSCIPWTSFTGFNLNFQKALDYLPPIFTMGKHFEQNGKTLLPLAIQVHHAVCDGLHLSRFIAELEDWAAKLKF